MRISGPMRISGLRRAFIASCFCAITTLGGMAQALTIDLEFASGSYFKDNATAHAAIQQAATDLGAAITSSFAPVDQYEWQKSSGGTSGTYTWSSSYTVPGVGSIPITPSLPADTVKIFVRSQVLYGSNLGQGGPAGFGWGARYSSSSSGAQLQTEFQDLLDLQSTVAQNEFLRGGNGPVISTLAGTSDLDFGNGPPSPDATGTYSVSYGAMYGSLALDIDVDDNGSGDTPAALANYWHLDHTTSVASNKNDLYSVALHEMLHALGMGASQSWTQLASGTTWLGSEAIAERGTGSGAGLLSGSHIASSTMSKRITDGATQEVAMDPNITQGTRKYLTTLDLAFLRDLGYSTVSPSFGLPGDFNSDGTVDAGDYTVWRDGLGTTYTVADYTTWKTYFGTSSAASFASPAAVPEPSTVGLLVLTILIAGLVNGCLLSSKKV